MRLSWNEVRVRAASFAKEWRDAAYEKGETQSFYNDFFEVFDVRRRSVARYEEHVAKLEELQAAGVTQFNIYLDNGDEEEIIAEYGRSIIPAFRLAAGLSA